MKIKIIILLLLAGICLLAQIPDPEKYQNEYFLRRGDVINIEVMDHPEFTKQVQILPDGTIGYPILGTINVIELSARQLEEIIRLNLEPYIPIPVVTVYVVTIYGEKIKILGYVNQPGEYQIYESVDLLHALALAGGITNQRKVKYIRLIRADGTIHNIKISQLWFVRGTATAMKDRIMLEKGDTLIVQPPAQFNWSMFTAFIALATLGLSAYNTFGQ